MALVLPSHRIHTIHGVFGSPSWSSILPASGSSASHESSFTSLPNTSLSSARGRGANLSALAARTAIPSSAPLMTRPRRSSIHGVPVSMRRAPPPPPSVTRATITVIEDPFADKPVEQEFTIETLPQPRVQMRTASSFARTQMSSLRYSGPNTTYVYSTAAPQRAQIDDQRTAKLVASVLLSRASGKPMRRRLLVPGEKPYVKSGLSRMVAVEC